MYFDIAGTPGGIERTAHKRGGQIRHVEGRNPLHRTIEGGATARHRLDGGTPPHAAGMESPISPGVHVAGTDMAGRIIIMIGACAEDILSYLCG